MRPVDINRSDWDCSLEADETGAAALRLGLRMVKGLSREAGERIAAERTSGDYTQVQALLERAGLDRRELGVLASSGACSHSRGTGTVHAGLLPALEKPLPLFPSMERYEATPLLRNPPRARISLRTIAAPG